MDYSTLSNDELFKLLKSSGINAGPITPSTRSVYEKKLKNCLNDVTTDSPKVDSPVKESIVREPVVELRAIDVEPIFQKPATPKAKPAPASVPEPEPVYQPVQVDRPRRSILRNSVEKQQLEPVVQESKATYYERTERQAFNAASTIQPISRNSEVREPEARRKSPMRQQTKEVPKPEFKLLRQSQPQQATPDYTCSSRTEPNIRKRTATVDRPTPLSSNAPEIATVEKPKANWGSLKFMVLVMLVTGIVYFVMTQMQSNPEMPI